MAQAPSPWRARSAEPFLTATLEHIRPCPAREEYIELCFTTPEGEFQWCFPEPPPSEERPGGPIALAIGPYGVQARLFHDGDLGLAVEIAAALPMIIGGAGVYIARKLVTASR